MCRWVVGWVGVGAVRAGKRRKSSRGLVKETDRSKGALKIEQESVFLNGSSSFIGV